MSTQPQADQAAPKVVDKPRGIIKRNPGRTREQILKSALKEFSTRGLDGARVQAIAAGAGVNKAMIYHYFEDKDALYLAVLDRAFDDIRSREHELSLETLEPEEGIARLISFTIDFLAENPDWIHLLADENLHRGRHMKNLAGVREKHSPLVRMIAGLLERGAAKGVFRAGIDPVALYISIAGQCYFFFSNRHTLSAIFGRDLGAEEMVESYRRHVTDMVLGALRP